MAKPTITIASLLENTDDLPVMPAPILRVMHLAGEPSSSAAQLAEAISAEPALAGRVLKFANSAYYGMPGEVTTIQAGVVLLGIKTVRNLAMIAAAHSWFGESASPGVTKALWEHAIAVAAAADAIATLNAPAVANEAFCAGLLHDIGKTVLVLRLGNGYSRMMEKAKAGAIADYVAEREALGFTHADIGFELACRWNLPERLRLPILYHNEPDLAEPSSALADIIHVADVLYWRSQDENGNNVTPNESAFERLGLESLSSFEQLVETMLAHQRELEILMEAA
jgi:HD-like signal output (HDOD) protein